MNILQSNGQHQRSNKKTVLALLLTAIISGCSHTPDTTSDTQPIAAAAANPAAAAAPYDTEKPTSYSEYKRWRKTHAPSHEAYAEYKEWEIAFRRWKAQQEQ